MISWFKKLIRIVRFYDLDYQRLSTELTELRDLIRERTDIHVDVSMNRHDPHQVIMVGQYAGRDYVRTYNLKHADFTQLIDHLKGLQKHGRVGMVDALPHISVVVKSEMSKQYERF